jgi:hypothetical protein
MYHIMPPPPLQFSHLQEDLSPGEDALPPPLLLFTVLAFLPLLNLFLTPCAEYLHVGVLLGSKARAGHLSICGCVGGWGQVKLLAPSTEQLCVGCGGSVVTWYGTWVWVLLLGETPACAAVCCGIYRNSYDPLVRTIKTNRKAAVQRILQWAPTHLLSDGSTCLNLGSLLLNLLRYILGVAGLQG